MNGDDLQDIMLGIPTHEDGKGQAVVWFGHEGSWVTPLRPSSADGNAGFALVGDGAGENVGHSLSSAGDFNGDHLSDVVIGALDRGVSCRVFVVFGSFYRAFLHPPFHLFPSNFC